MYSTSFRRRLAGALLVGVVLCGPRLAQADVILWTETPNLFGVAFADDYLVEADGSLTYTSDYQEFIGAGQVGAQAGAGEATSIVNAAGVSTPGVEVSIVGDVSALAEATGDASADAFARFSYQLFFELTSAYSFDFDAGFSGNLAGSDFGDSYWIADVLLSTLSDPIVHLDSSDPGSLTAVAIVGGLLGPGTYVLQAVAEARALAFPSMGFGTDVTSGSTANAHLTLTPVAAVVEPSSMLLLGTGLTALAMRRFRKRTPSHANEA